MYHCSTTPDFPRMSFLLQEHTLRTCHAGQAPLAKGMHRHLKVKCLCTQLAPFVASATNHRRLKPRVSHPLLFIRRWTHCCPATSLCQPLTSQFTATNSVCYVSFVYVRFCLACTQAASSQRHSSSAASQHLDTPLVLQGLTVKLGPDLKAVFPVVLNVALAGQVCVCPTEGSGK